MGKNQYLGGEEDAADRGPAGDPAAEEVVDGHVGAGGGGEEGFRLRW